MLIRPSSGIALHAMVDLHHLRVPVGMLVDCDCTNHTTPVLDNLSVDQRHGSHSSRGSTPLGSLCAAGESYVEQDHMSSARRRNPSCNCSPARTIARVLVHPPDNQRMAPRNYKRPHSRNCFLPADMAAREASSGIQGSHCTRRARSRRSRDRHTDGARVQDIETLLAVSASGKLVGCVGQTVWIKGRRAISRRCCKNSRLASAPSWRLAPESANPCSC